MSLLLCDALELPLFVRHGQPWVWEVYSLARKQSCYAPSLECHFVPISWYKNGPWRRHTRARTPKHQRSEAMYEFQPRRQRGVRCLPVVFPRPILDFRPQGSRRTLRTPRGMRRSCWWSLQIHLHMLIRFLRGPLIELISPQPSLVVAFGVASADPAGILRHSLGTSTAAGPPHHLLIQVTLLRIIANFAPIELQPTPHCSLRRRPSTPSPSLRNPPRILLSFSSPLCLACRWRRIDEGFHPFCLFHFKTKWIRGAGALCPDVVPSPISVLNGSHRSPLLVRSSSPVNI